VTRGVGSSAFRLPFLIAVALLAAALGDALVETVSNTGIFGPSYFDNNHLSIVPALLAGIVLTLEAIGLRCFELYRRARSSRRDWLIDAATCIAARSPARDIPYVFAMQMAALFAMESTEQLVLGGKLLGGMVWLGGPILLSVLSHALIGAACTFLLGWSMRAISETVASLVVTAIAFIAIAIARNVAGPILARRDELAFPRAQSPHARQIGERAPPLLTAPA
jgi:hypothetical protein